MNTALLLVLVVAAAIVAAARIYVSVRKLRREHTGDWDAKLIERLRAQGSDPFKPHEVSFFFGLPTEQASRNVQAQLESEGFTVDLKPVPSSSEQPFSLHASKALRLSVPEMRELGRRFSVLARANGGRYDGWTAGVVARDG